MKILIAGASGFIGSELVKQFEDQHSLTVLGRDLVKLKKTFTNRDKNSIALHTWQELSNLDATQYDVIINLSGYNISASRWSDEVKNKIIDSRVNTTKALVNWAIEHKAKPHFISANAVGIYGLQANGDTKSLDEDSVIDFNNPKDFISKVGIKWQEALKDAIDLGMQVTILRFGVVLKKGEGMLKKLHPSFYFGLGSIVGDGSQIISWIHIEDLLRVFSFVLEHPELTGAINVTSPYPVAQKDFAKALADAMHRPMFLTTPAFVIKLLFGEMGEELLLHGQKVVPKRLLEAGYKFKYQRVKDALKKEYE